MKPDLMNQRAIHYAIAHKQEGVFEAHLDYLAKLDTEAIDGTNMLTSLNCGTIPYTIASFCVIKQSWRCLAKYLERHGVTHL